MQNIDLRVAYHGDFDSEKKVWRAIFDRAINLLTFAAINWLNFGKQIFAWNDDFGCVH